MKPKLKTLREAASLSQEQIAKQVGVSQPHYHRWEAGETPIPVNQLKKLAKVLKTTPEKITGPKLRVVKPPGRRRTRK